MLKIRLVTDLDNYMEVLEDVDKGSPVVLVEDGIFRYIIMDLKDYLSIGARLRMLNYFDSIWLDAAAAWEDWATMQEMGEMSVQESLN